MRHVCPECGETLREAGACPRDGARLAPADDPVLGQTIGSWRVASLVGSGGMGRVYRAVQPNIGARVAIKVLARDQAHDLVQLERFFAEARVVNLIRHENIVNVLDLLTSPDGPPCIVMEYLDGSPLSAVIAGRAPLPVREVIELALDVLAALAAAHQKGIVHRDLKPENVFVTPGGRAKVLDFGIAKLLRKDPASGPTQAGAFLGTPAYLAPEQVREARDIDGRADLYSLGVVMFEALTGRLPFAGPSVFNLLRAHVETPPPRLRDARPDVPEALEGAVLRALEKTPDARYRDADAMADALRAVLAEKHETDETVPSTVPLPRTTLAPPPTPEQVSTTSAVAAPGPPASPPRARLGAGHAALLVLLLAAVVVTAGVLVYERASRGVAAHVAGPPPLAGRTMGGTESFDATAFYPEAEREARAIAPDAKLVSIWVTPMRRDGRIDASNPTGGSSAAYRFFGTRADDTVSVFVQVTGGRIFTTWNTPHDSPRPVPPPRCTTREVGARVTLASRTFDVTYSGSGDGGAATWRIVGVAGGGREVFSDSDCGR